MNLPDFGRHVTISNWDALLDSAVTEYLLAALPGLCINLDTANMTLPGNHDPP